ncbi:MAG: isoleucine--tRNA ligase [Planctomycetota bacterium]
MAFAPIGQAVPDFPALERATLEMWAQRDVFHRALAQTAGGPEFVFYEGPPTANGLPHNGHVLTRVVKDLFPRYKTMRGHHVERRAGWDTHGLPVEVEVEKELRISGKAAIVEYGVDRFAQRCLASVFRYTKEWEHLTERIGFWVDLDRAYVTFHKSYVESVWWALAQLFEKGLLYKGHKVVWWWAQGGTALSAGEVGNSYKTVNDPSVYVRLPLRDEEASLLVWTTTPWTLPSNTFAAVHPDFDYAYVEDAESGHTLVLAKELVPSLAEKLGRELNERKVVKGRELIGRRYTPPFDAFAKEVADGDTRYWRVIAGDKALTGDPQYFVTLDAGTGIVHMAPAFGEDDYKAWQREQRQAESQGQALELFCAVRSDGGLDERLAPLGLDGVWVKDADKALTRDLRARGLLLHSEAYRHDYPFCWRSDDDPLIQYARSGWFIRTTAEIERVITNNQAVTWQPEHVRDGRFGAFLAGNVDWALSRERFWGTPLNVWECESCDHAVAPASCADIEARNPDAFAAFRQAKEADPDLPEHLIVHKPWVDQVTFPCEQCGATMRRVPEVIDCWFDSGCMPFAQLGYPHTAGSVEAFKRSFPADFISEAIDQTRGWFYSLMMVSNLVFGEAAAPHPYRRCIVLGHVLDKAGKKESKSSGNYTPPEVILDAVRMEFATVGLDAPYAKGLKTPPEGEIWIAREDLEGLDLKDGATVDLYRLDREDARREVKVRAKPKLPRRIVLLADGDRTALELALAPADVMPVEVPKLPADQRVAIHARGVAAPGADAFRWFFFASNPPWNNTRHALCNVRAVQRELPIKLHNIYAFFVTYANIDGFDPSTDAGARRPVPERALLDRWVRAELERTKQRVVTAMDDFESYAASQELTAFVEGLSNWYVRRSRDRFWAQGREQDKLDAYWTLYECLSDLALLLAPFLPFAAERMYQNLVVEPLGDAVPDSVHLARYPEPDASIIDGALCDDMADVRALVSMGLQVRASNKLKTRQPLRSASVVLARPEREAGLRRYAPIMAEELNVKDVVFLPRADELVTYKVKPNFPALGARLGPKMKAAQKAITGADPAALKAAIDAKGAVELDVNGESLSFTADELLVGVEARPGFAAAGDAAGVVALDTKLDDELIADGLFREVLSRVQAQRKELQLDYAARIKLGIRGSDRLLDLVRERAEELQRETLTNELVLGASFGGTTAEFTLDEEPLAIEVAEA